MTYAFTEKQKAMGGYVYFLLSEEGRWKIGRAMDPVARLKGVQTGCASPLTIYGVIPCRSPGKVERSIHRRFKHLRMHGEWFSSGDDEIVNFADTYAYDMTVPGVPHNRLWVELGVGEGPPPKLKVR